MGKIAQRCTRRADVIGDTEHVPADETLELIDESVGELYLIVSRAGCRYFERIVTLTTDGTNKVDEPAPVLSTVGVWYVDTSGKRRRIPPMMPHELETFANQTGEVLRYELVDGFFYFYPTPATGSTFELRYVPQPPDVSGYASDDCVDVVLPDGLTFLIWSYSIKVKGKKEEDVRLAMAERERYAKSVYEWAVDRAITEAPRRVVSDVDLVDACRREGDYR